ncbi:MAG: putative O-glycosylation ligase, exosortase A system-associated [Acidobacteria bacterium]|nr:putative O-glycosylation ligase, exosortase A system-associated [Acidobacteriota bacterium]
MAIRDILVLLTVFGWAAVAFFRPWLGVCGFAWVSYMNPHRMAWGLAVNFPVAMVITVTTVIGAALKPKDLKFQIEKEGVFLLILWLWFCLTTFFALNPDPAKAELIRVSKILFMTFMTMILLVDRKKIAVFLWIIIGSIGFLALKGGVFSLVTGGAYLVFGPENSFLADNNDFAHALCMVLPLIVWQTNLKKNRRYRILFLLLVIFTIISILLTYSRGGFVTLIAVLFFYWFRSKRKIIVASIILACIIISIPFLPDAWYDRIHSIQDYEQDASAQGRFNAWKTGWNVAKDRPIVGGGFQTYSRKTFQIYSPQPDNVHDVHSIYFEILGEHGFPGAAIFFLMIASAILSLIKMRKIWSLRKDQWAEGLCNALLISLIAYLVGGLFLGRASFDLFYHFIAIVVAMKRILKTEPVQKEGIPEKEQLTGDNLHPQSEIQPA